MTILTFLLNSLIDFAYPPRCLHCNEWLEKSSLLCKSCQEYLYQPLLEPCKFGTVLFEKVGPLFSLYKEGKLDLFVDFLVLALDEGRFAEPEVIASPITRLAKKLARRYQKKAISLDQVEDKHALLIVESIPSARLMRKLEKKPPASLQVVILFN